MANSIMHIQIKFRFSIDTVSWNNDVYMAIPWSDYIYNDQCDEE